MFGESQDKIKYALNNCPFCGSPRLNMDHEEFKVDDSLKEIMDDIKSVETNFTNKGVVTYYVNCKSCEAKGPPAFNPKFASNQWNKCIPRPDPLEEAVEKK